MTQSFLDVFGYQEKEKKIFLKKVHFSGFAVQNRSGKMAILGRILGTETESRTVTQIRSASVVKPGSLKLSFK